jgi:hypothetical protein
MEKVGPSTTWWQKKNKNHKDSQMGQATPKKIFFNNKKLVFTQTSRLKVTSLIFALKILPQSYLPIKQMSLVLDNWIKWFVTKP